MMKTHALRFPTHPLCVSLIVILFSIFLSFVSTLISTLSPATDSELNPLRELPGSGAEYKNFSDLYTIRTLSQSSAFPLVISPVSGASATLSTRCGDRAEDVPAESLASLLCFVAQNKDWLKELETVHGALLFRGFSVASAQDFAELGTALLIPLRPFRGVYLGTSPRVKGYNNTNGVYTASEIPANEVIPGHLEMSFKKIPPKKIVFWAELPNLSPGGESPLTDFRQVWRDLDEGVKSRFREGGLRYIRHYFSDQKGARMSVFPYTIHRSFTKSWEAMFETTDPDHAEAIATGQGFTVDWVQGKGNLMCLSHDMKATRLHPETGDEHWNNHLNVLHATSWYDEYLVAIHRTSSIWVKVKMLWQYMISRVSSEIVKIGMGGGPSKMGTHVVHTDGSDILEEDMQHLRKVMARNTVTERWQKGDVMFLDNFRIAHGRNSYVGPRSILTTWSDEIGAR